MTLYSRRTFSKESFQWTKCVVKYLYDAYSHLSHNMLAFLVEVKPGGRAVFFFFFISYIYYLQNNPFTLFRGIVFVLMSSVFYLVRNILIRSIFFRY